MLTWELFGAAVGAGLASGREIAAFFGRYGGWGYGGVALAVAAMGVLAGARLPSGWRGRWPQRLWRWLQALLLMATGGAMLAGGGALAATLLPTLRWPGMAFTLLLGWLLADRIPRGMAWVSRMLLAVLMLVLLCGLRTPQVGAAAASGGPAGLLRAAAYGGFNAALLHPLLDGAGDAGRRALPRACGLLGLLLCAGQAALLRHPGAMGAEMPFLALASGLGGAGKALVGACLYMAILTTLAACLRGLRNVRWGIAGLAAASALGFGGVVDAAYPLLGGACAGLLTAMRAANFVIWARNTFHSGRGVI